eukprot:CAMPEP_0116894128 /NCGR_PEP_ID=MMETSP0467-20121206/3977_1 /TAXON_ID=283647 /ORGANISM="Mesodinium pulex, Strain SPMC105" /LENGTH=96 /DNA_ID=CAMNT_0004564199 /DNA_START=2553 /DNA_END=2843 /DNA_ORIENTATION=-
MQQNAKDKANSKIDEQKSGAQSKLNGVADGKATDAKSAAMSDKPTATLNRDAPTPGAKDLDGDIANAAQTETKVDSNNNKVEDSLSLQPDDQLKIK